MKISTWLHHYALANIPLLFLLLKDFHLNGFVKDSLYGII